MIADGGAVIAPAYMSETGLYGPKVYTTQAATKSN
jgi:hypothetical protein